MLVGRWLHERLSSGRGAPADSAFDERVDVDCIRREMLHALRDCRDVFRKRSLERIRNAAGPQELWMLRAEIFLAIAQDHGQLTATQRINGLTPLFRGWVPAAAAPRTTRH
jgi:hypothetical protein